MGCGLSKPSNISPATSKSSFSSDIDSVSSTDKKNGIKGSKNRQKKLVKKRNRNQVHTQNRRKQSQEQSRNKLVSNNGHGDMHLPKIYVNPPTPIPPSRTEAWSSIVHHDNEDASTNSTTADGQYTTQTPAQTQVWLKHLQEHSVKMPNDQMPGIIAAGFLNDGTLAVLDKKNNSVKHYSETFSFLAEYKLTSTVIGMCSSQDKIYVAVTHGIHVLQAKVPTTLEVTRVIAIQGNVHAIATTTESLFIVISSQKPRQIQRLDLNGDVIKTEELKTHGETSICPEHVCVQNNGDIFIANEFDSAVYIKKTDKSIFEATGINFNHINGIVSCQGGILVAGHDYLTQNVLRKYQYTSNNLCLVGSVKKEDLGFVPWGLAVRNTDRHLVTGGFQEIMKVHSLLD